MVLAFLLVASGACRNDDADATPDNGGSGVAAVDSVTEIVEAGDTMALRGLLEFQTLPCTIELGAGGPPKCPEGEDAGAEVAVFAFGVCEPEWRSDQEIDTILEALFAIMPVRYAAFEPETGFRVDPDYVVVFEGPDPRLDFAATQGAAVGIRGDRVVEMALSCGVGDGAAQLIPDGQDAFLIAPPSE